MRHLTDLPNATRVVTAGLFLVALLAAGCSSQRAASDRDTSAPGSSGATLLGPDRGSLLLDPLRDLSRLHLPLAVGNRWDYVVRYRTRLVSNDAPEVIEETEGRWTTEIVSLLPINEHDYYLEVAYDPDAIPRPPQPTWGLRQDPSGLYSLDLYSLRPGSAAAPATHEALAARFEPALAAAAAKSTHAAAFAAAGKRLAGRLALMSMPGRGLGLPGLYGPAGFPPLARDGGAFRRGSPLPGEIALLVYPLFESSRWIVRDSPRFSRVVVNRETTRVPAGDYTAWVMRGFSELYGPRDVVHFWQASDGLIKLTVHGESEAVDNEGNPIGRMIIDMDQSLTAFTVAPRPL